MPSDLEIPIASYRAPRPPEPGFGRVTMIAGGVGAAFLLGLGVYSFSGGHRTRAVPVIEADSRPIRVKPDNPGGMQVAGQDDDLLSGGPDEKGGKLGPAPETPQPQALRAQPEPPAPRPAPAPIQEAPPAAVPAAPQHAAAPPAATPPAARPAETGATSVQLGALETEADAKTEWDRLARKMPDLLGSRHMTVSRTDRDGKTWFRLRVGGFADIAQATAFCAQVRAKGGACNLPS